MLAQRFDVGLSPIREALSKLSTEGWVVQNERRGFAVGPANSDELWDLHHARCMLYESALRDSITYGDLAWEHRVIGATAHLTHHRNNEEDATTASPMSAYQLHRSFHTSLISACRSQRMVDYCEQLFDEIERYRHISLNHGQSWNPFADTFQDIADAAVERNADHAIQLVQAHFTDAVERASEVLEAR